LANPLKKLNQPKITEHLEKKQHQKPVPQKRYYTAIKYITCIGKNANMLQ